MFRKAWALGVAVGLALAGAPATLAPVPDFRARGAVPAPDTALAFRLDLPGQWRLDTWRYLDGKRAGHAGAEGEGPAVVVAGYAAESGCPVLLVGAIFHARGVASGGACALPETKAGVRLVPVLPQKLDPGVLYPVAWVSFRDDGGELHQAWWLLSWQGR